MRLLNKLSQNGIKKRIIKNKKWFKDIAEEQKIINEELTIKGSDNHTL